MFQSMPELPAISRASLAIWITGEAAGDFSSRMMPQLDLTTDNARAFLLALREGTSPIVVADNRSGFQLEFAVGEDGPAFTVSKPGQKLPLQRFNAGWRFDVRTMAAHLLADLGP